MLRLALFFILALLVSGHAENAARPCLVNAREEMVQLQIFLDQQLFGPGKIDGRAGEFTTKALKRYQRAHGLTETGVVDANIPLDSVFPVYTEYVLTDADVERIGECPTKPVEQAKKKVLPYDSLLEFLTERYHSDPALLARINPGLNLEHLKAGDTVRVPNVEPFKIEELPKQGNLPSQPQFRKRIITVDRKEHMLELTEGDALLAALPITPGSETLPTPEGSWRILGVSAQPTFRWDEGVLNHGVRTENFYNLPAGPNNPVGVMWVGLNKPGIGIHGTNNPQTIGRAASHGCMRVANWDIIRLSKLITEGMTVIIK
jgi:lipoprotein-anchoring transpeptidase ErfK/SrfK